MFAQLQQVGTRYLWFAGWEWQLAGAFRFFVKCLLWNKRAERIRTFFHQFCSFHPFFFLTKMSVGTLVGKFATSRKWGKFLWVATYLQSTSLQLTATQHGCCMWYMAPTCFAVRLSICPIKMQVHVLVHLDRNVPTVYR